MALNTITPNHSLIVCSKNECILDLKFLNTTEMLKIYFRYIRTEVKDPLPDSFDWVPKKMVASVKDQGT